MRVAVAGGTGVVGRYVVSALEADGHEAVVLSRSTGVDVASGAGLAAVLARVDAVVDVLSVETNRRGAAEDFFTRTTLNLQAAERSAGVRHHVCLSIVGIDGVPFGYYQGKVAQEAAVTAGQVPWTILRATQFHEFAGQVLDRLSLGPVCAVPRMLSQPIAAREVGAALARLAVGPAIGRVPDLGGPRREQMLDLARKVARARGLRGVVVPLRVPGAAGRAMRDGTLCPSSDGPRGVKTFDEWLATARW
jgi:uncharacterized protein YbjT (DUF2867 family)